MGIAHRASIRLPSCLRLWQCVLSSPCWMMHHEANKAGCRDTQPYSFYVCCRDAADAVFTPIC